MRAARAARLFFLTRPIKLLICGVVVAVAVVDAEGVVVAVSVVDAEAPLRFDNGNVNDNATNQ